MTNSVLLLFVSKIALAPKPFASDGVYLPTYQERSCLPPEPKKPFKMALREFVVCNLLDEAPR